MRIALAVMFALATVAPMTVEANAAKMKKCLGTALDSSKVSFKCKASQKCCFDTVTKKGTCVAASAVCL